MNGVLSRTIINISILIVVVAWAVFWASNSITILYNSYFTPCENNFFYDYTTKLCECQFPFFGTLCENNECENGALPEKTPSGWVCKCTDRWFGKKCNLCGTYDASSNSCLGELPWPNSELCASIKHNTSGAILKNQLDTYFYLFKEYKFNGEVDFFGSNCQKVCLKIDNSKTIIGDALALYRNLKGSLLSVPMDVIACPDAMCYGCTDEGALCVDGAVKSRGSNECNLICEPCDDIECKPCNHKGNCILRGDNAVCQCQRYARGATCENICPGVSEVYNGITTTLTGPECYGFGSCDDNAVCICNEDPEGTPLFIENCKFRCPVENGLVCAGHGTCQMNTANTNAVCICEDSWFNPTCSCSDGSAEFSKTCVHGECNLDSSGCNCHDDDISGHWDGPFCSLCKQDWFTEKTFCLQYCNPETTCEGNAKKCVVRDFVVSQNTGDILEPCALTKPKYELITSGSSVPFMTQNECEAYSKSIGASFGLNNNNPGFGCVVIADKKDVRYNTGICQHTSGNCDCSSTNICVLINRNGGINLRHNGMPDSSISEQECQRYAESLGIWGRALESEYEQIMLGGSSTSSINLGGDGTFTSDSRVGAGWGDVMLTNGDWSSQKTACRKHIDCIAVAASSNEYSYALFRSDLLGPCDGEGCSPKMTHFLRTTNLVSGCFKYVDDKIYYNRQSTNVPCGRFNGKKQEYCISSFEKLDFTGTCAVCDCQGNFDTSLEYDPIVTGKSENLSLAYQCGTCKSDFYPKTTVTSADPEVEKCSVECNYEICNERGACMLDSGDCTCYGSCELDASKYSGECLMRSEKWDTKPTWETFRKDMLDEGVGVRSNDDTDTLSLRKDTHNYLISKMTRETVYANMKVTGGYWDVGHIVYLFQDAYKSTRFPYDKVYEAMKNVGVIQPRFVKKDRCATCKTNFQPNITGGSYWNSSCIYYCNPTFTEESNFPEICTQADGTIREECVFCSGKADSCSETGLPTCNCLDGFAGTYCQSTCSPIGSVNSCVNGQCIENDLANFFDLGTLPYKRTSNRNGLAPSYECKCNPQDEYTKDERDNYENFLYVITKYDLLAELFSNNAVEIPDAKTFFGNQCFSSCKTDLNGNICSGRGNCRTYPLTGLSNFDYCNADSDCNVLAGTTIEDKERFCHFEKIPKYWQYVETLQNFQLSSCSSEEVSWIKKFISNYDWDRYCYNYISTSIPEELNTMKCSACTELRNTNLWQGVATKCTELVKYTNYEVLGEKTQNCSLLCQLSVTDFDWKSWCVEPKADFEEVCSDACLSKFQDVDWITDNGFCASINNYTNNVKLQESACATFKDANRDACDKVDFTEATTEYEEVTPCFISKQSILSTETGEEVNQPYSGVDNERICGNAVSLHPQVCGTTEYVIPFVKRTCNTNSGSNFLDTGLSDCELSNAEHQYCSALFPNGWSFFGEREYVVLLSQTEIDNPPTGLVYATNSKLAIRVNNVVNTNPNLALAAAAIVGYEIDGTSYTGTLVGQCELEAPLCFSCGSARDLKDGTGASINTQNKTASNYNPNPQACCNANAFFQASSDGTTFWCHEGGTYGVDYCAHDKCVSSIRNYDWKGKIDLIRDIEFLGVQGKLKSLQDPEVRDSFNLHSYCNLRQTADSAVVNRENYKEIFNGECSGDKERAFYGNGDNPCTGDSTDCIERCYQQCKAWNEDGTYTSLGFIIIKLGEPQEGRCWCEAVDSSSCTRSNGGDFYRYDYLVPTDISFSDYKLYCQSFDTTTPTEAKSIHYFTNANVASSSIPEEEALFVEKQSWWNQFLIEEMNQIGITEQSIFMPANVYSETITNLEFSFNSAGSFLSMWFFIPFDKYRYVFDLQANNSNGETLSRFQLRKRRFLFNYNFTGFELAVDSISEGFWFHVEQTFLNDDAQIIITGAGRTQTITEPLVCKNICTDKKVSKIEISQPEKKNTALAVHDIRVLDDRNDLKNTYLYNIWNNDAIDYSYCNSFLTKPTGIENEVCLAMYDNVTECITILNNDVNWAEVCANLMEAYTISDSDKELFCGQDNTCVTEVNNFLSTQIDTWVEEFIAHATMPMEMNISECTESLTCKQAFYSYSFTDYCSSSLRAIINDCSDCGATLAEWRQGFNKKEFCDNLYETESQVADTLKTGLSSCSSGCNKVIDGMDFTDFCLNRLSSHDVFAPHALSHNLSAYCRDQVFITLSQSVMNDDTRKLDYDTDCTSLGTYGSVNLYTENGVQKSGQCRKVDCKCTEIGLAGDRCNINCPVSSFDDSACNEKTGLGKCCAEPKDETELTAVNCATDILTNSFSFLSVGSCVCFNSGTDDVISGFNCEEKCKKCNLENGQCSLATGTCLCVNNAYRTSLRSNILRIGNTFSEFTMVKASVFANEYGGFIDKSKSFLTLVYAKKYCESLSTCIGIAKDEIALYQTKPDLSMTEQECRQYAKLRGLETSFWVMTNGHENNNPSGCQEWTGGIKYNPVINNLNCYYGLSKDWLLGCIQKEPETTFYVILTGIDAPSNHHSIVSFISAYVPEIREADEDNEDVPIIFDWANQETVDGKADGDQTIQTNVLLLYSPEDPCKALLSENNIDKCCTWTDFTDSDKNPFHPSFDANAVTATEKVTWPSTDEVKISDYAKNAEPTNTDSVTSRFYGTIYESKCPSYRLVNGRYRVEYKYSSNIWQPIPVSTSKYVMFRNQWCYVKKYQHNGVEYTFDEAKFNFGLISKIECPQVKSIETTTHDQCHFPFFITKFNQPTNEFVIEEIRDCTDSNIIDGFPGKEVVYASDGSEVVTTLYDFQSIKSSITTATGIINPTYCITKPWFQNVTEYIERVSKNQPEVTCRKNTKSRNKCTNAVTDLKEGNCLCGTETCSVNEYCYTKVVDEQAINECHSCENLMSPAPETCCNVNEYLQYKEFGPRCVSPDSNSNFEAYCKKEYACPVNYARGLATTHTEEEILLENEGLDDIKTRIENKHGITISAISIEGYTPETETVLVSCITGFPTADGVYLEVHLQVADVAKEIDCDKVTVASTVDAYVYRQDVKTCSYYVNKHQVIVDNAQGDLTNGDENYEFCKKTHIRSVPLCGEFGSAPACAQCPCITNVVVTSSTHYFDTASWHEKGSGAHPEYFCDLNSCWDYVTNTCKIDCDCNANNVLPNAYQILKDNLVGGHNHFTYDSNSNTLNVATGIGEYNSGSIPIDFIRVCKDAKASIIDNSDITPNVEEQIIFDENEFIRYDKASASNPSYKCGDDCTSTCPGSNSTTGVPCNGRGVCNVDCSCSCFSFSSYASRAYFIKESKEGSTIEVPSYAVGGASAFQSPFRGKACEATCPGWDEGMIGYQLPSDEDKDFIMDELICSGKGTCLLNNKGTSQCACEEGYVSGIDGNCEFVCPGAFTTEGTCGGHGTCSAKYTGATGNIVEDLIRVNVDLQEEEDIESISVLNGKATMHLKYEKLMGLQQQFTIGPSSIASFGPYTWTISKIISSKEYVFDVPLTIGNGVYVSDGSETINYQYATSGAPAAEDSAAYMTRDECEAFKEQFYDDFTFWTYELTPTPRGCSFNSGNEHVYHRDRHSFDCGTYGSTCVSSTVTSGGLKLYDTEYLNYNPNDRYTTASHKMTSFVTQTSTDGETYLGEYYVSNNGKKTTDSLITNVKFISVCPASHPYVYHHGMYCCGYKVVANGTTISRQSPIEACSSTKRMRCPTVSWYKKNTLMVQKLREQNSDFQDGDEFLINVEDGNKESNQFTDNPDHYTCDPDIKLVKIDRELRPLYDTWGVFELSTGLTENLMFKYRDTTCSHIRISELNLNGLSIEHQPQTIQLLQCSACSCEKSSKQGFWDGLNCENCQFGFAGSGCKNQCNGVCGKIQLGQNEIWYEEYQRAVGITDPCINPQTTSGIFYECPATSDIEQIFSSTDKVFQSSYKRSVYCLDGVNSPGSCVTCPEPLVGNIDLRYPNRPDRVCQVLTCPLKQQKMFSVSELDDTEYSNHLYLSTFYEHKPWKIYGPPKELFPDINSFDKTVAIDMFTSECPTSHPHDLGNGECCTDNDKLMHIYEIPLLYGLYNNFTGPLLKSNTECATLAMEDYRNSRGLFTMRGGNCYIYKGRYSFNTRTIFPLLSLNNYYLSRSGHNDLSVSSLECEQYADSHPTYYWYTVGDNPSTWSERPNGCVLDTTTNRIFYNANPNTITNYPCSNYYWDCIQTINQRNWHQTLIDNTEGLVRLTSNTDYKNYIAYFDCPLHARSQKTLNTFTTIQTGKTVSASKTYETACEYDLNGDIIQAVDIYEDEATEGLTYTTEEKVNAIVTNRCFEKFYEACREGHDQGIQNPFLTWHAFKKVQDHVYNVWPSNKIETDGCKWHKLVSKIWCPHCPLCEYSGTYPNLDLEVNTDTCDVAYFPYCSQHNYVPETKPDHFADHVHETITEAFTSDVLKDFLTEEAYQAIPDKYLSFDVILHNKMFLKKYGEYLECPEYTEAKCEKYAESLGLPFMAHDDAPITDVNWYSNGGCYCTSYYGAVDPEAGGSRYIRGWSTANGVANYEACRDICYNLPEAKVPQGCNRLPRSKVRSGVSGYENDQIVYIRNTRDDPLLCLSDQTFYRCISDCLSYNYFKKEWRLESPKRVIWGEMNREKDTTNNIHYPDFKHDLNSPALPSSMKNIIANWTTAADIFSYDPSLSTKYSRYRDEIAYLCYEYSGILNDATLNNISNRDTYGTNYSNYKQLLLDIECPTLYTKKNAPIVFEDPPSSGVVTLGRCEADCDNDNQCAEGLYCYQRYINQHLPGQHLPGGCNIPASDFSKGWDYCIEEYKASPTDKKIITYPGNPKNLGLCEGDCDYDSDCLGDLKCFQRPDDNPPFSTTQVPGCISKNLLANWDICYMPPEVDTTFSTMVKGELVNSYNGIGLTKLIDMGYLTFDSSITKKSGYFYDGIIILDNSILSTGWNLGESKIDFETYIKPYCHNEDMNSAKYYGNCLDLKNVDIAGNIYLRNTNENHLNIYHKLQLSHQTTLPTALYSNIILEQDVAIVVFKNDEYYNFIEPVYEGDTLYDQNPLPVKVPYRDYNLQQCRGRKQDARKFEQVTETYASPKLNMKFQKVDFYYEMTSGPPDMSMKKDECQKYASDNGYHFYHDPAHAHYAMGCSRYLLSGGKDIYWSENPLAINMNCGDGSHSCIYSKGYAPTCSLCSAGHSHTRYSFYNQPFDLYHGTLSSKYDPDQLLLQKNEQSYANAPFRGCTFKSRNGKTENDTNVECSTPAYVFNSGIADAWVRLNSEHFYSQVETSYESETGRPKDPRATKMQWPTTGCYGCDNGQYQDEEGQTTCKTCPPGRFYSSIDNPWKTTPMVEGSFKLGLRSNGEIIPRDDLQMGRYIDFEGSSGCPAQRFYEQDGGGIYDYKGTHAIHLRYLHWGSAWGLGNNYCCTTQTSGCSTYYTLISPSDVTKYQATVVYPYEWWNIPYYPAPKNQWHDVDEWVLNMKGPRPMYFISPTNNRYGTWRYDSMINLEPVVDVYKFELSGSDPFVSHTTSCYACPDNWASIPFDDQYDYGDVHGRYPTFKDSERNEYGNKNCLICPPGYDTGIANHLTGEASNVEDEGNLEKCPADYPFSTSVQANYLEETFFKAVTDNGVLSGGEVIVNAQALLCCKSSTSIYQTQLAYTATQALNRNSYSVYMNYVKVVMNRDTTIPMVETSADSAAKAAVECNDPNQGWTHFTYDTSDNKVTCFKLREYENISLAIPNSVEFLTSQSTSNAYYLDGCKPCSTQSTNYVEDYIYYKTTGSAFCLEEEHIVTKEQCETAAKVLGYTYVDTRLYNIGPHAKTGCFVDASLLYYFENNCRKPSDSECPANDDRTYFCAIQTNCRDHDTSVSQYGLNVNLDIGDYRTSCNGYWDPKIYTLKYSDYSYEDANHYGNRLLNSGSLVECANKASEFYNKYTYLPNELKIFEYDALNDDCMVFLAPRKTDNTLDWEPNSYPKESNTNVAVYILNSVISGITGATCLHMSFLDSYTTGSPHCRRCPIGKYNPRAGSNCIPCPPGQYAEVEGLDTCKICQNGKYAYGAGSSHCDLCPPGQYVSNKEDGNTLCLLCQAGKYQDESEKESCKDCPVGKVLEKNYYSSTLDAGTFRILESDWNNYNGPLKYYNSMYDYSGVHGIADTNPTDNKFVEGYSPVFEFLRNRQAESHDHVSDCLDCPAGSYYKVETELDAPFCEFCPAGQYSETTGGSNLASCLPTCSKDKVLRYVNPEKKVYKYITWDDLLCPNNQCENKRMKCIPERSKSIHVADVTGTWIYNDLLSLASGTGITEYIQGACNKEDKCNFYESSFYNCNTACKYDVKFYETCHQEIYDVSPLYNMYDTNGNTYINWHKKANKFINLNYANFEPEIGKSVYGNPFNYYEPLFPRNGYAPGYFLYWSNGRGYAYTYSNWQDCYQHAYDNQHFVFAYYFISNGWRINCVFPHRIDEFMNTYARLSDVSSDKMFKDVAYQDYGFESCPTCYTIRVMVLGTKPFDEVPYSRPPQVYEHINPGNNQCMDCPTGFFANSEGFCQNCEPGYKKYRQTPTIAQACTVCTGTTYQNEYGSDTNCKDWVTCGTGKQFGGATTLLPGTCSNCPVGRYQNEVGHRVYECKLCSAGYFQNEQGKNGCKECVAGYFQNEQETNGCKQCGAGKYSTDTGATSDATCKNCDVGKYSTATGATSDATCQNCDAGKYSDVVGATSDATCQNCDAGSVTNTLGNVGATTCTECAAGKYSPNSQTACQNCDAGSVTNTLGNVGATTCTECAAGKYSPNSQTACQNCPAGSQTNTFYEAGASTCTACRPGYHTATSTFPCVWCDTGKYQNEYGQSSCKECDEESIAPNFGSTSCTNCNADPNVAGAIKWNGCLKSNDVRTSCYNPPSALFWEGYGDTGWNGHGTGFWTEEDLGCSSGCSYELCGEICKDHTKYTGFIHRARDGKCWCEPYGGYAARYGGPGASITCKYDYNSEFEMYSWVHCINGEFTPPRQRCYWAAGPTYKCDDFPFRWYGNPRSTPPLNGVYGQIRKYCPDDPAQF